jgi:tRNA-dihydrouridine synthase B
MGFFMIKLIMIIGSVVCKNNLILAPMASVTDLALKSMSIRYGADSAVSEMVSAKGLKYGSKNTFDLLQTADNESIKVLQLFGLILQSY